jgi:hypothetical protein
MLKGVHHPLRFLLGLYPMSGWIIGLLVYDNFPSWYIEVSEVLLGLWILYESIVDYIEYGDIVLDIVVNFISFVAGLSVYYLITNGFPVIIKFGIIYDVVYLYIVFFIIVSVVLNVVMFRG